MGNAFEGLNVEEARAKAEALREAEPTEEQTEGGYTPRMFYVNGDKSHPYVEIEAIDIPVTAVARVNEVCFAVTWETAYKIAEQLDASDDVHVWFKDDDEIVIFYSGSGGWNSFEKSNYYEPAVLISNLDFEVVAQVDA